MRTKAIGRLSAVFVILGMLFWVTAGLMLHSFAAGKSSISLDCRSVEGMTLPGMHWRIYLAADCGDDGKYTLQGGFSKYKVVVDAGSDSALAITAQTLSMYAELDKTIIPVAEGNSDAQGSLVFDGLEDGMYLVCGENYKLGDTCYTPAPFMIEVTNAGGQNDNIMVNPKYSVKHESEGDFSYTVKKFWDNDEMQPWYRSESVDVEIYCDGELYETVTLNDQNHWEYSWHSTSIHDWRVKEVYVPSRYYVIYRYNEYQFAVVNTYTEEEWAIDTQTTDQFQGQLTDTATIPETIPGTQDTGTSVSTAFTETDYEETGSSSSNTDSASDTEPSSQTSLKTSTTRTTTVVPGTTAVQREKLPQTGQLWWPVPVLTAAGLILMTIGIRLRPKE